MAAGPLSERILFVSDPQGIPKLYVVRPDGKELKRVTAFRGPETEPALSAASGLIAYRGIEDVVVSSGRLNWDLFTVDLKGKNRRRLTKGPSDDHHPSWSPEGQRLVFSTNRWGANELALLRLEDLSVQRLTYDQTDNTAPSWSPNGEQVAFVTHRNGYPELYLFDVEHHTFERLTQDEGIVDGSPTWSPDGKKLAFGSEHGPRKRLAIKILDLETRTLTRLELPKNPAFPCFSPDGSELLFAAGVSGQRSLYRYRFEEDSSDSFRLAEHLPTSESDWRTVPLPW